MFLKIKESENNKLRYLFSNIVNIVRKLFCGLIHIPFIKKTVTKSEGKGS